MADASVSVILPANRSNVLDVLHPQRCTLDEEVVGTDPEILRDGGNAQRKSQWKAEAYSCVSVSMSTLKRHTVAKPLLHQVTCSKPAIRQCDEHHRLENLVHFLNVLNRRQKERLFWQLLPTLDARTRS